MRGMKCLEDHFLNQSLMRLYACRDRGKFATLGAFTTKDWRKARMSLQSDVMVSISCHSEAFLSSIFFVVSSSSSDSSPPFLSDVLETASDSRSNI